MSYREIPSDRVLEFKATPGFKGWRRFFTRESVRHPAKMNLNLLRWILETYTERGETVLDPMAGTGSTVILAALKGRNGVALELEPKFCAMIRDNMKLAKQQKTLTAKGKITCVEGDARRLSSLLTESDAIITSPPYGNRLSDVAVDDDDSARMGYRQSIDVVLTSPPYGEAQSGGGIAVEGYRGDKHSPTDLVGERSYTPDKFQEDNISRLPHGDIDAIVSSPPYEDKKAFQDIGFMKSIVHEQNMKAKKGETKAHYRTDEAELRYLNKIDGVEYEENNNIGNLKSDSYLEAMLQVYRECWKVLKTGGRMVLVTKNFIRDKQVVRLDLDTIRLCEAAGFRLVDRWYFELPTKSFWRILYQRKYPEAPTVNYEDVLIFLKS